MLKDFFVSLVITGIMTRTLNWYLQKKLPRTLSYYLSFLLTGFLLIPVMSTLVGFDVMVAEYIFSLIIWLTFDLVRTSH